MPTFRNSITDDDVRLVLEHGWKSDRKKRKWKNPLVANTAFQQRLALRYARFQALRHSRTSYF